MAPTENLLSLATQNPVEQEFCNQDNNREGHPPQRDGFLRNTGRPNQAFYTPWTYPDTGTLLSRNDHEPALFKPLKIRSLTFKNRIIVSPMCQYSAETGTGKPTDWHLVHSGQFAIRGAGAFITEAAAVLPNGRISPEDLGIWSDDHIPAYKRITDFLHSQGCLAGIQLAHAGRKASTYAPWLTDGLISKPPIDVKGNHTAPKEVGGWLDNAYAPSKVPFSKGYPDPVEMTEEQIKEVQDGFVAAAKRAIQAGYDFIEIHGAHGYLTHEFCSPLSNKRTDKYGQDRTLFATEITKAVRAAIPEDMPLWYRVSATDWHEEGEYKDGKAISWGEKQTAELAIKLKALGVDLLDVSSGGNDEKQKIQVGPSYQVPFAEHLKRNKDLEGLLIGAVGLITNGKQAEGILSNKQADVVLLAREFLRNADFVFEAAQELGASVSVPVQYQRAFTRMYQHKN